MRKVFVYAVCGALIMSGCGTYEGAGTYAGAQFGSILGSAIGGISDGPRGSDIGTIIGMAGGAAIGGAIGAAKDKKNRQEVHDRYEQVQQRKAQKQAKERSQQQGDYSGFDATNSGDDRLYDLDGMDGGNGTVVQQPMGERFAGGSDGYQAVEVRNARFVDENHDGVLSRGEMGRVTFEIFNRSSRPLYDVQPVVEVVGNKHVLVSPGVRLERVAVGEGLRYTALVKDDGRLKNGMLTIVVSVRQGSETVSQVSEFHITTSKR